MPWACAWTDPGRGTPRSCWLGISRRGRAVDRVGRERRAERGPRPPRPGADAKVTLTRTAFDAVLLGEGDGPELFASGAIAVAGDGAKLGEFLGLLDEGDPVFAIVTP